MNQCIFQLSLLVHDYDEAIRFYTCIMDFDLIENTLLSETKRWVVVKPKGDGQFSLLLAKAATEEQKIAVGNQTGGRVFLFMHTDDCWRDYHRLSARGVEFLRLPAEEVYGTVCVFRDIYGNLWDLIQPKEVKTDVQL